MAVMTHAHTQAEDYYDRPVTTPTAHYRALTPQQQNKFDEAMECADNDASNAHLYLAYMAMASVYANITLPQSVDIALCDCYYNGCGCDLIFDSNLPGAVITATNDPGCNLSRIQCPDCGHDHPRPIED